MLKNLDLSQSNYYDTMRRPVSESKKQKQVIKNEILRIWKKFRRVYDAPKITQELRKAIG